MATPGNRRALVEGSTLSAGVLLVFALVGMVNYFGFKYYKRFDWTGSKLYTLSPKTLQVAKGLTKPIEVTIFLDPQKELYDSVKELLERYASATKQISVRTVDPEKNPVEAQRLVDKYKVQSLNVVVFDSGDDRRVVDTADLADYDYSGMQMGQAPQMTGFKGEEAFTGAILELVEKRKPRVLFTTGHGEAGLDSSAPEGLSRIGDLLGKENFQLESWASLGKAAVPDGTDLVVVAGPRAAFLQPELDVLDRYLAAGGRMLVLVDPELEKGGKLVRTGLEEWLGKHGVRVDDDIVVDPSSAVPFYGAETLFVQASGGHPIAKSLADAKLPVIVSLARSVAGGEVPAGMEAQSLLETTADGWGEKSLDKLDRVEKNKEDLAGPVSVGVAVGPKNKSKVPNPEDEEAEALAAMEKDKAKDSKEPGPAWRLAVFGDSDFLRNGQIANVGNPTLAANTFNWLVDRQRLLGIGPKKPEQTRLLLSQGQLSTITWTVLLGFPALAVAAGIGVYLKRRR